MKSTKAATRALIADAIRAARARIAAQSGDHPQIVAMRTKNEGYLAALEDCALALDGCAVHLRIMSETQA